MFFYWLKAWCFCWAYHLKFYWNLMIIFGLEMNRNSWYLALSLFYDDKSVHVIIFFNNIFDYIPISFLKSYYESYDKQLPSIDASPLINKKKTYEISWPCYSNQWSSTIFLYHRLSKLLSILVVPRTVYQNPSNEIQTSSILMKN